MPVPTTPLFVKTHDLIVWVLRHSQRFPRHLRHSYTMRLENTCFEFEEQILLANASRDRHRQSHLDSADRKLLCLRSLLRYTFELELLGRRQIEYAAQCVDELGRLLGAWKKGTDR